MSTKKKKSAKKSAPNSEMGLPAALERIKELENQNKVLLTKNINLEEKIKELLEGEEVRPKKTIPKGVKKVKMLVLQPFLMGGSRYEKGDTVTVDREKAINLMDESSDGGAIAEPA